MVTLRNSLIILLILALAGGGLWLLYSWPKQAEHRLREALGPEFCRDWSFKGLRQEGLDRLRAEVVVIPSDPRTGGRELVVLTDVEFRSRGPLLPGAREQALSVECAGGEVTLQQAEGVWNWEGVAPKLLAILRDGKVGLFRCKEILTVSIQPKKGGSQAWRLRLGELEARVQEGRQVTLSCRLYHESWAGGGVSLRWVFRDTPLLSLELQGRSCSAPGRVVELFCGPLPGVKLGGTCDLSLKGEGPPGAVKWEGKLRATAGSLQFEGLGLSLADLSGVIKFSSTEIGWDSLAGTLSGFEAASTGELNVAQPKRSSVRIDVSGVPLSTAWKNFVDPAVHCLFPGLVPKGMSRVTLKVRNPLSPEERSLTVDAFAAEAAFGTSFDFRRVQVRALVSAGSVREASVSWGELSFHGVSGGAGSAVLNKGESSLSAEFHWSAQGGTINGGAKCAGIKPPAMSVSLSVKNLPWETFWRFLGREHAPRGMLKGELELDVTVDRTSGRGRFAVTKVDFENYLTKLVEAVGADPKGGFEEGALNIELGESGISIRPLSLLQGNRVLVLRGSIGVGGQADMKALSLELKDRAAAEALLGTELGSWGLSAEQKQAARAARLVGPVNSDNVSSLSLEEFFAESPR